MAGFESLKRELFSPWWFVQHSPEFIQRNKPFAKPIPHACIVKALLKASFRFEIVHHFIMPHAIPFDISN